MMRSASMILMTLVVPTLSIGAPVNAGKAPAADYALGDTVPLSEDDLRNITLQVLARNPLLSSSPGIRFAGAQRSVRSTDLADVIFYPHAETAGVKEAFQVGCWREAPDTSWTCGDAEIRRYVKLDSQAFEVRVEGDIGLPETLALIASTRATLQASAREGKTVPQTAILILPYHDGYMVDWGSPEGHGEQSVHARLVPNGDPSDAKDWLARVYEPDSR